MAQIEKNISVEKARIYSKELIAKLATTKEANFELLLQDARQQAAKNGLTEEILKKLLANR